MPLVFAQLCHIWTFRAKITACDETCTWFLWQKLWEHVIEILKQAYLPYIFLYVWRIPNSETAPLINFLRLRISDVGPHALKFKLNIYCGFARLWTSKDPSARGTNATTHQYLNVLLELCESPIVQAAANIYMWSVWREWGLLCLLHNFIVFKTHRRSTHVFAFPSPQSQRNILLTKLKLDVPFRLLHCKSQPSHNTKYLKNVRVESVMVVHSENLHN